MNSSIPELVATGVSFAYPGRPGILTCVDLTLRLGEMVILVGENACGKSTLLRLLCGLLRPTSGTISVRNMPSNDNHRAVGMILQNPDHQLFAETVEAELSLGLEYRNWPIEEIRRIVEHTLSSFGLSELRNRSPQQLSGGQKQRLAVAAMIASGSGFLLLDEPDSYLDARARREWRSALEMIRPCSGILWASPHLDHLPTASRYLLLTAGSLRELAYDEITDHIARTQT